MWRRRSFIFQFSHGSVRDMAAKMRHDIRDSLTKDIRDSFKDIKDRMKR